jgi:AbrB family looped-hinge helix DNA binding protein
MVFYAMKATIDKAGRVVIPVSIRKRAGIKPGTEPDVVMDDIAILLIPSAPEPKLVRRGKRLIANLTAKPEDLPVVDLAAIIEEERNRWPGNPGLSGHDSVAGRMH